MRPFPGRWTALAAVLVAVLSALVLACGDNDSGDSTPTPGATATAASPGDCLAHGGMALQISGNHGHKLVISVADFESPPESVHTYSIQGTADHAQFIDLTGKELAAMVAGNPVSVVSSANQQHRHTVIAGCANP